MKMSRPSMAIAIALALMLTTASFAQTIPFVIAGSGDIPGGWLPLAPGFSVDHNTQAGWGIKLGSHTGEGGFELVAPPDLANLTADFASSRAYHFTTVSPRGSCQPPSRGGRRSTASTTERMRIHLLTIPSSSLFGPNSDRRSMNVKANLLRAGSRAVALKCWLSAVLSTLMQPKGSLSARIRRLAISYLFPTHGTGLGH